MTDTPKATKWNRKKLTNWDVRRHVPPHIVEVIDRPHDHESEGNKPIWIIWRHVKGFPPVIDTLCDTADSAVYHYGMLAEEIEIARRGDELAVHVERVPANHRFASSLNDVFLDATFTKVKLSGRNAYRYGRDGD